MNNKLKSIFEQKFRVPKLNVKLAVRSALLQVLHENKQVNITTLVSPTGFGKSTLMSQYYQQLSEQDHKVAWIALDSSDNEANQFINLLCHALVYIDVSDEGLIHRANNRSAKKDLTICYQDLLTTIEQSKQQIFVMLDDFHFIHDDLTLTFIDRLLHYCPNNFHVIITSQVQPNLSLSAFYAKGSLFSLTDNELKFSLDETHYLLGKYVNEHLLKQLYQQTEGWPVALQLLRLWYQQHQNEEKENVVINNVATLTSYIKEQVFEKFDQNIKEFLVKTAILDRFDVELANYICDINNSAEIIAKIKEYQSFVIILDNNNYSFRYHHLFSDFLKQTLFYEIGEQGCNALRSKAANWYAMNNHLNEAINQCVKAKNIKLAAQLIGQVGSWELVLIKGIGYVESILSHFSTKDITQYPTIGLLQSYFLLKCGQVLASKEQYHISEQRHKDLLELGEVSGATQRDFSVLHVLVEIYLDEIIRDDEFELIHHSLSLLEKNDHLARGTILAAIAVLYNQSGKFELAEQISCNSMQEMPLANCWVGVNYTSLHQGHSLAYRGHLADALALFNKASELAEQHFGIDSGLRSMAMCLTADIYYQMGLLAKAKELLEQGISSLESKDSWYDIYSVTFKLAIDIALSEHDRTACSDYLYRANKIVQTRKLWRLERLMDVFALKVALHFDDDVAYKRLNNKIIREDYWQQELYMWKAKLEYHATQALYFLNKNTANKALFHCEKLATIAIASKQLIETSKAKIIAALAYSTLEKYNKAFDELAQACRECSQFKIKQVFFEVPPRIEALLRKFKKQRENLLSQEELYFIGEILHSFSENIQHTESLGIALSNREQQLVPLLVQGMSNKEIASNLGVSDNTVKFHLKNLFSKIGVTNRSEAAYYFVEHRFT